MEDRRLTDPAISMYCDVIDNCIDKGDFSKANIYIEKLRNKYGYEYIENKLLTWGDASPGLVYDVMDFKTYKDYSRYCQERYAFRVKTEGLLSYDKPVGDFARHLTQDDFDFLQDSLEVECIYTSRSYGTESAYVNDTQKIYMIEKDRYCDTLGTIAHELGHIYENRYIKGKLGIYNNMGYASSSYASMNPSECFAENFGSYFTNPSFLKHGWPEVYEWFHRTISNQWEQALQYLLKK
jgi:hypothetical protein